MGQAQSTPGAPHSGPSLRDLEEPAHGSDFGSRHLRAGRRLGRTGHLTRSLTSADPRPSMQARLAGSWRPSSESRASVHTSHKGSELRGPHLRQFRSPGSTRPSGSAHVAPDWTSEITAESGGTKEVIGGARTLCVRKATSGAQRSGGPGRDREKEVNRADLLGVPGAQGNPQ